MATIHVRGDGGMDVPERWSDSRCILKVELTGSLDGLDVGCERKRRVRGNANAFSLRDGKGGFAII